MQNQQVIYKTMSKDDFSKVVELGTQVHGEGYIDDLLVQQWFNKGIAKSINANFVAYIDDVLVGFRLTYAVEQWQIDKWCTPQNWPFSAEKICYFKCNTVNENYRGYGIGSKLLELSIETAKQQGALAGISHLWKQSPGNSAVKYFTKCGGKLIKVHNDRWNELSKQGYHCPACSGECHCQAAEMVIEF